MNKIKDILILDNVEKIQLDQNNPPINNYQQLNILPLGLWYLAKKMRYYENNPEDKKSVPLSNLFHWFATSAVNYLRLIGLIDIMNKKSWSSKDLANNSKIINEHCKKYVETIIPEILNWRHKVGGHFAATMPYSKDNLATLEMSIMSQLSYESPYWYICNFKWCKGNIKSEIKGWALTEQYEQISKRCFPRLKLPPITYGNKK